MSEMGLFIPIFKFRQQKSAEKLFTALLCRQYMGTALPVAVGGWSLPVGGATYFLFSSLFREEVIDMVTYSDLILIGQLIVAVLNLFVHIYNNKKK